MSEELEIEKPITTGRASVWILRGLAGIVGVLIVAAGRMMIEESKAHAEGIKQLNIWRAETTANRFTSEDGLRVWREIASIREAMAALPKEVPPKWFVERVDRIEQRQTQILDELATLRAKLKP
jgi:uncharacterized protein (DUF2384 family)